MSEKLEPRRLFEIGTTGECKTEEELQEWADDGFVPSEEMHPVTIVPGHGGVREMWEWQVNHLQTEIVTRARRDAILEEPSHTWSASDFRPVWVIDREVGE